MFIAVAVFVLVSLMLIVAVRGRNHQRINEGRPTIFQELMIDVRKNTTPRVRDLDDITEPQAEQYALELITFVVRFVCRDAALTRLTHPAFGTIRQDLNKIIEDALLVVEVIDPAHATPAQQVKASGLILNNADMCDELLKYCLSYRLLICGLRASVIDPRVVKRSVIRDNLLIVPSVAAMTWLRLMHEALADAN